MWALKFARAYLITFLFHLLNHSVPLFGQHFASHLTSLFFDFLLPSSHDFIRPNSLALWLLFLTNNLVSCILCCHFSCFGHFFHFFSLTVLIFPISDLHSPIRRYVLLSSSPHLSLPSFWNGSSSLLLCYFMSLLSLLLPPNCPSTHHHIDGERHVPEQSKGAAWSGEGQCTLFPSLLCIFHLHATLPHGCAGHSWILGGRSRAACGPKTRGKWGYCRRGRRQWWEQQWQCIIKCGWRTPAPVTHLPEHHSCACTLYGYHDCRWVGSSALLPSGIISCLTPFPFSLSHYVCKYKCWPRTIWIHKAGYEYPHDTITL